MPLIDVTTISHLSAGAEVKYIQDRMELTDSDLVAVLGLSENSGLRRLRRWKDDEEAPSGPALITLRLLYQCDRALSFFESGEYARGVATIRDAMPELLQ